MWPSLIEAELRTRQPDLMHDLCQDRKVVGIDQDISRVFEGCCQLQDLVQPDLHPIGWFRRPGPAHREATD